MEKCLRIEWNQNKKNKIFWNYIYKLTLSDGSTYVGLRYSFIEPEKDTGYMGSGKYVDKSKIIKKEILIQGQFSDKELADLETFYIKKDKEENPLNLNFTLGAGAYGVYNYSELHSDKVIDILRKRAKERWENPEVRSKLEHKRKTQNTEEVKNKISKTVRNSCADSEWKKQHSDKIKKALQNPDTQKKLKALHDSRRGKSGRKWTEEEKQKQRDKMYILRSVYLKYKNNFIKPLNWNDFQKIVKSDFITEEDILNKLVLYINRD